MDYMHDDEDKRPIELAMDELRRVDHLIFVSLKYTRTVDVLKNVVGRVISTYDYLLDALLLDLKEKGKIQKVPKTYSEKTAILQDVYSKDKTIISNIGTYMVFRKLLKAEFDKKDEYRRHVKFTAKFDEEASRTVNIDNITEDFRKLKGFLRYVLEITQEK